jgi:hypothetical protein
MLPKHTNNIDLVADAPLAADDMWRERRWLSEGVEGRVQAWLGMMMEKRQHKRRTTCEVEQQSI